MYDHASFWLSTLAVASCGFGTVRGRLPTGAKTDIIILL